MSTWVYGFGGGDADGAADMRQLLGGKGANLAEMSALGLPVPPGFTITTAVCNHFYANDRQYPAELEAQVQTALKKVETQVARRFGDPAKPLLVSVRSGAPVSMPGMMDTVLNLGLNDDTVHGLAQGSGDRRFALDSYRRFIQMFGDVVLGVDHYLFETALTDIKAERQARFDNDLDADALEALIKRFKNIVQDKTKKPFPQDVDEQLWGAIGAVFKSWQVPRAITYRRLNNIDAAMGTAVNVQAMVFGNMGNDCATGVAFTRDPSTGANQRYGEYLINAQGEDVVAGIRTPGPLTQSMATGDPDARPMQAALPQSFAELEAVFDRLEKHYRDMQDIEFTIEAGKLFILQTRSGKRTTEAALKIAVDMAAEGLIDQSEALMRVAPASLDQLLHPSLDPNAERTVIGQGLPASPGAVSGKIALSAERADEMAKDGDDVVLVRIETSPDDIHGMHVSKGILTSRGGMTSHAAVVARGMGKACVCGAGELQISYLDRKLTSRGQSFDEGDEITIDGSSGQIMAGRVETVEPKLSGDFETLMRWADDARRLKIRANAETPLDCKASVRFGCEGVGLCRTEHMFFQDDRILAMREMILAEDAAGRRAALDKILPMQRQDLIEIFEIMEGRPVTIRLLDPPLHEFLPHDNDDIGDVAKAMGVDPKVLIRRLADLEEANPMLGLRGCRLAILYPEIPEMQARAIFEAAIHVQKATSTTIAPEVMVPLVGGARELEIIKRHIDKVAAEVEAETGIKPAYEIGTMIELPRAALRAGDIAEHATFFSYGTNDLTQMTMGISRDDAGKFLDAYTDANVFKNDPFQSLDTVGVGELIDIATVRGRDVRPGIKLGICGEHGGDPASVEFCHRIGLDYVSCSPYRVPIARLAAAQAVLRER